MSSSPSFLPIKPRLHRKRRSASETPAVLTLVSASFDEGTNQLQLGFNQAINIDAFDPTTVVVEDNGFSGNEFQGSDGSGVLISPTVVQMDMAVIGPTSGGARTFSVGADNGITPASGGDAWAGAVDAELPYP